jgi:hypothetical protein
MKKLIYGLMILAAVTATSCKKDKNPSCESTVAGIAGSYKITHVEADYPSPVPDQDMTDFVLSDNCAKSGIYTLKADKTFTYTESGTGCSTSDSGSWDIVDSKLTLSAGSVDFASTPLTSWDCTTFIVTEDQGSNISYKFSFTKQ